ncbi:ABC transporter permease [Sphaerisporangium album]|uniref:ABC transporter permease n=1 Tax=Sphaerisporangium album TaxID=509200 RepID=A0A367EXI4_9ACTN|nr:ABC transporter permease subunit [Sphaerisporangium album]RCG22838.1 ABC transporter permease [Sphaerisporangium album]
MINALSAEALLLRRRPAAFVVGGVWVLLVVGFGFAVPYIVYATLDPVKHAADRAQLLDILLPSAAGETAAGSYPLFGGAIMLILGVLITGSEYRWGTWPARLAQGPTRTQVVLAKTVAGAVAVVVIAAAALVAAIVASIVIASVEGRPLTWPGPSEIAASLGATALISVAWMSVGAALGVVFRGVGTALGVGLLWTLGLENALSGLAGVVPALEPVRTVLLGPAGGSLVAALGVPSMGEGGSPGVAAYVTAPVACLVLAVYTVAGVALATALIRRRDIT